MVNGTSIGETASLDSSRAFEVVELIRKAVKNRNKAAVMVTHDERMLHASLLRQSL